MNQTDYLCNIHESPIISVCLDQDCKEHRMMCFECIEFHEAHLKQIISIKEFIKNITQLPQDQIHMISSNYHELYSKIKLQLELFLQEIQIDIDFFTILQNNLIEMEEIKTNQKYCMRAITYLSPLFYVEDKQVKINQINDIEISYQLFEKLNYLYENRYQMLRTSQDPQINCKSINRHYSDPVIENFYATISKRIKQSYLIMRCQFQTNESYVRFQINDIRDELIIGFTNFKYLDKYPSMDQFKFGLYLIDKKCYLQTFVYERPNELINFSFECGHEIKITLMESEYDKYLDIFNMSTKSQFFINLKQFRFHTTHVTVLTLPYIQEVI